MPQGGIDPDEDPRPAAVRELYEETGVTSVEYLGETPDWMTYDFPPYHGPPHRFWSFPRPATNGSRSASSATPARSRSRTVRIDDESNSIPGAGSRSPNVSVAGGAVPARGFTRRWRGSLRGSQRSPQCGAVPCRGSAGRGNDHNFRSLIPGSGRCKNITVRCFVVWERSTFQPKGVASPRCRQLA